MRPGIRICQGAVLLLLLAQCTVLPAPTTPDQQRLAKAVPADPQPATPATQAALPTVIPSPTSPPLPSPPPQPTEDIPAVMSALPLRARFRARPGDQVTQVKPGVIHIRRSTDDPLKINILLFDLTASEFSVRSALGEGWLSGRYRTSYFAQQDKALAAVNGDLFSGDGKPQGMTIVDGQVAIAPKYRATFAWSRQRGPFIGYFTKDWTWHAEVIAANGARQPIPYLNIVCDPGQVCLFNDLARIVPARAGDVKVLLDAHNRVIDIVQGLRTRVITGTQVLQGTGAGARWLLKNMAVGDSVRITITTDPPLSDFTQAVSGGPIILRDGQFVQDCLCALSDCSATKEKGQVCEDFSTDWKLHHYLWVRMPRTGIGFDQQKQTLIVAVVDGYQRGYSRGITQEEFADLLREFGAYTAMELDGGGSSTMVLNGKVMNRPPDQTGERYVANALLFFWNDLRPADLAFSR